MRKNILGRIRESKECGYHRVLRSNHADLLGPFSDHQGIDDLLVNILNLDEQSGSRIVSDSTLYYEEPDKNTINPLVSGLANAALAGPVDKIHYVDMRRGYSSDKKKECLDGKIKGLYEEKPSNFLQLVLVNAGVSPSELNPKQIKELKEEQAEDLKERRVERAGSLAISLIDLPSHVFRVGIIASPEFAKAVNLENLKEGPEQPQATTPTVALAS